MTTGEDWLKTVNLKTRHRLKTTSGALKQPLTLPLFVGLLSIVLSTVY